MSAFFSRRPRPKSLWRPSRRLIGEQLEPRHLLAADFDGLAPRHNGDDPCDVDASGVLSPLDALLVINQLNQSEPAPGLAYTDVDADGAVTQADADRVFEALGAAREAGAGAAQDRVLDAFGAEAEGPMALALPPPPIPAGDASLNYITAAEVETLLARAAGATSTEDAIIAIVDRGGRILGVRMEQGVLDAIPDLLTRVFAVDGAVAKARTAAFFANNQAPLTSRTIRSLSQSTITEREVESNPTVPVPGDPGQNPFFTPNPIARTFGPGVVAPIGLGGHFPADIDHTPPVDLFRIELQSRDGLTLPGLDGIKGTLDDIVLDNRFNIPDEFLAPGVEIPAPESYGVQSDLVPHALGRGLATLPGGIPLYKWIGGGLSLVGGIGVFFPGPDGYATHEQGFVPNIKQTSAQRLNAPKALEAEYIAIAAAGGVTGVRPIGLIGGLAPPPGYILPFGRIDLVGLQLEVFGPNPTRKVKTPGIDTVIRRGQALGVGSTTTGENQPIDSMGSLAQDGKPLADGWLVLPHDSPLAGPNQIKQADVETIVANAITGANQIRAAIRLNVTKNPPTPGVPTKMVIAVADTAGNVLGLYRMPDATFFSIDVAIAKARNTAYYADAAALQPADMADDDVLIARGFTTAAQLRKLKYRNDNGVLGLPDLYKGSKNAARYPPLTGLAFTNRTFRFLAEPRYPAGVDGSLAPVFSILTDVGINRRTAENVSQADPTPAGWFLSVMGFDAFHASRNFRDPSDLANQNGIVFFPGSTPLYASSALAGGLGVSGDGVDQDDVVTSYAQFGYAPPQNLRADMTFYRNVRLPFQKFNRNPKL